MSELSPGRIRGRVVTMTLNRRTLIKSGGSLAFAGLTFGPTLAQDRADGFTAASSVVPGQDEAPMKPGLQGITAICEVTGGGEKVYAIAMAYDVDIDPESLALDTFATGVVPAAAGYFPGMPVIVNKNDTSAPAQPRAVVAIYSNNAPARRLDRSSAPGRYVIAEFAQDNDLSIPTTDSEKVIATQLRDVRTTLGATYPASATAYSNVGPNGIGVSIRGLDAWEQSHWWWDDTRATWLEYSIYLPKSFLAPGGENKAYPLLLAITHSGTSYDGTCRQTLTETCIASIWAMPEEQEQRECVVITPRYERTTMNDYWEHTHDVENTHRLVESLLSGT